MGKRESGMKTFYAVLEMKKMHGMGALRKMERHNTRDYAMSHIDENLTYLNRQVVSTGGLSYVDRWKEILSERELSTGHPIKVRKNAVTALDFVTAMSPGAENALQIDIDKWCEKNKEWFEKTFGAENILVMELHMDEVDNVSGGRRGVHLHTIVVPLDERDHLCARNLVGRSQLKAMQTSYGHAMKEFGLSRGEDCSKIHHSDRRRWYHAVARICRQKAPRIEDGETMEQYLSRLDNVFQDQAIAAEKLIAQYERRLQLSQTRQAQIFSEYAYAVNLQHILEEEYEGDMRLVNERLKNLQLLEKSVPRKNLDVMVDKMLEKYPPENNFNFFRLAKKKKHPKWESLPTETETSTTSTSSAPIFPEEEEVPLSVVRTKEKPAEAVTEQAEPTENILETPPDDFMFRGADGELLDD